MAIPHSTQGLPLAPYSGITSGGGSGSSMWESGIEPGSVMGKATVLLPAGISEVFFLFWAHSYYDQGLFLLCAQGSLLADLGYPMGCCGSNLGYPSICKASHCYSSSPLRCGESSGRWVYVLGAAQRLILCMIGEGQWPVTVAGARSHPAQLP